jgi:hypothetical protein
MIIEVVLTGLAGWRLASLLVDEDGPGLIFESLRRAVGVKPGLVSGFIPSLFSCVYCMSVWTTSLMWLLWYVSPEAVSLIAAWAMALVVHRIAKLD